MSRYPKSIFSLLEIFRQSRKKIIVPINLKKHCDQKGIHDFYCKTNTFFMQIGN